MRTCWRALFRGFWGADARDVAMGWTAGIRHFATSAAGYTPVPPPQSRVGGFLVELEL